MLVEENRKKKNKKKRHLGVIHPARTSTNCYTVSFNITSFKTWMGRVVQWSIKSTLKLSDLISQHEPASIWHSSKNREHTSTPLTRSESSHSYNPQLEQTSITVKLSQSLV